MINFYSRRDYYTKYIPKTDRQSNSLLIKNDSLDEVIVYQKLVENNYELIRSTYLKAEEDLKYSSIDINFSGTTCVLLLIISNNYF